MARRSPSVGMPWLGLLILSYLVLACSRDHIDFGPHRSAEEEQKINLERSIHYLEAKRRKSPADHRLLAQLGHCYGRKADWVKMASAFEQASLLAPSHADYFAELGLAQFELGRLGVPLQFEAARSSLQACVSKDANLAKCHQTFGQVEEYSGDLKAAMASYSEAIVRNPTVAQPYLMLAWLYYALKLFPAAEAIICEGKSHLRESESNLEPLGKLHLLASYIALAKQDPIGRLTALEQTLRYAGDSHPEYMFELGMAYAWTAPPKKEQAERLLTSFVKRCCRSPYAARFGWQCTQARLAIAEMSELARHPLQ